MAKKKEDKKETGNDKAKRLNEAFALMKKTYKEGSVFLGAKGKIKDIEVISTGSDTLNHTSGIGGFPRGRIIEIYGKEGSGKTTLALHAIAEAQKAGLTCAFIDAEHALDPKYATKIGVNVEELLISQPDYGEQAIEMTKLLAESGLVDCVVIDSVAALVPKAELEGNIDKAQVGVHARLMSKAFRIMTGGLQKNNVLCMMINQTRTNVGVMYGNPEVTTGGNALRFYSSMRIRVAPGEKMIENGVQKGHMLRIKFHKNKMAAPFTDCEVPLIYGVGFDLIGDLFTVCLESGIIEKVGTRKYLFKGEQFANSKGDALQYVTENEDMQVELREKLELFRKGEYDPAADASQSEEELEDGDLDIDVE